MASDPQIMSCLTEPEADAADEWQMPLIDKSALAALAIYMASPRVVRHSLNRSDMAFVSDRALRSLHMARFLRDGIL